MLVRCSLFTMIFLLIQLSSYAESHHPQEFLQSISESKHAGKDIYNHFCVTCHAAKPMISLGAPRIGEENDWGVRLKQGMDVLFKHTNEGFNSMPSRGGCFECSDKQLIDAIEFMLSKKTSSKKNITKD